MLKNWKMEPAKPIAENIAEQFSISKVLEYFESESPLKPTYPAQKAKAGEIYLITWKDDSCKREFRYNIISHF